ncbi:MAG TPA: thiamine pyrophosphate-dependent dehydrogenase E1 component subunit alpha [Chlamydiales bacterium]|nr:thiamine pyrophosphate-dependent dehydrogenase E1 component subunit alpha [Chlamydiales bacterium]
MSAIKYPYRGLGKKTITEKIGRYEPSKLHAMHASMLRIRLIEEAVADRYREDKMKTPIHLAIGQEAIAVGSCEVLRKKDYIFCGHRTHGNYLAKGGDINAMFSEFHCRLNGCCASRGGSMHLIDKKVGMEGSSAIVAGIIPIATGFALATKQKKEDRVVVVYLGDAAVEEGSAWESMNFAKLKSLPIIYLCENNYYSVCSPLDFRQPQGVEIYKKAEGFGLKSSSIDGNDVLAVFEETQKAVQHIKNGGGPVFIEAHTYRWRGHHGSGEDSHIGYRSPEELAEWKAVDPVKMFQEVLIEKGLLDAPHLEKLKADIKKEIEAAFEHALNSPFPTKEDLLTHVYSE